MGPAAEALRRTALAELWAYRPADPTQVGLRERFLDLLAPGPQALGRDRLPGHLTASALVLDAAGERGLLLEHPKLGRWLQPGGHLEWDASLAAAALREVREETGLERLALAGGVLDLDLHPIPARRRADGAEEPGHWHYDVRFLVRVLADPTRPPGTGRAEAATLGPEAAPLRWFRPAELDTLDTDDSVRRLFRRAWRGR